MFLKDVNNALYICKKIMFRCSTYDFNYVCGTVQEFLYILIPQNSSLWIVSKLLFSLTSFFPPSSPFPSHHLSPDSSSGLLGDDLYVWPFPFLSVYPVTANPVYLSETSCSYITSLKLTVTVPIFSHIKEKVLATQLCPTLLLHGW